MLEKESLMDDRVFVLSVYEASPELKVGRHETPNVE